MSVESTHVKRLRKWVRDMEADAANGHLSDMELADLRSLKWAVETVGATVGAVKEQMAASVSSYQDARRAEFADRRANRTALRVLKRLRSIVTDVKDASVLASVDSYLRQKHTALGNGTARPFMDGAEE